MGDQLENQWNELRDSIEIQDESPPVNEEDSIPIPDVSVTQDILAETGIFDDIFIEPFNFNTNLSLNCQIIIIILLLIILFKEEIMKNKFVKTFFK